MTPAELLRLFDAEVRGTTGARTPTGWTAETDGPLIRAAGPRRGYALLLEPDPGLSGGELAALVSRTTAFFGERGTEFEWKTYDHDIPALPPLLLAAGARPEEHEALVVGEAEPLTRAADGVDVPVRRATGRTDLERIAAMESEVWDDDWSWLADVLEDAIARGTQVYVAEIDGRVVSAAWLEPVAGTRFAGLWGGSTLAAYRGRGIYRSLVAARARAAIELGHDLLQVDASDDSRPILERLGLTVVGGTRPYLLGGTG